MDTFRLAFLLLALTVGAPSVSPAVADTGHSPPPRVRQYIFGDDDRVHVSTAAPPWSAIALVRVNFADYSAYCSGAFVTSRLLLTAGHCLYESGGGMARSVDVYPARDGDNTPRGVASGVTALWVPDEWRRAADAGLRDTTVAPDYGVVLLPTGAASPTSTLMLGAESDATLAGASLAPTVAGYPSITYFPDVTRFLPYAASRPSLLLVEPGTIGYDVDATEGQSGGPVLAGSRLVGIHHGSVETCHVAGTTRPCNIAKRIDAATLGQVTAACRLLGGTTSDCAFQSIVEPAAAAPTTVARRTILPIAQRAGRW